MSRWKRVGARTPLDLAVALLFVVLPVVCFVVVPLCFLLARDGDVPGEVVGFPIAASVCVAGVVRFLLRGTYLRGDRVKIRGFWRTRVFPASFVAWVESRDTPRTRTAWLGLLDTRQFAVGVQGTPRPAGASFTLLSSRRYDEAMDLLLTVAPYRGKHHRALGSFPGPGPSA